VDDRLVRVDEGSGQGGRVGVGVGERNHHLGGLVCADGSDSDNKDQLKTKKRF
jgi:hypothetical protein